MDTDNNDYAIPLLRKRKKLLFQPFGFRKRLFLFFIIFLLSFASYFFSFLMGNAWGIWLGDIAYISVFNIFSFLFGILQNIIPIESFTRILDGLLRLVTRDIIVVIVFCALFALIVSSFIAISVALYKTRKLIIANGPVIMMESEFQPETVSEEAHDVKQTVQETKMLKENVGVQKKVADKQENPSSPKLRIKQANVQNDKSNLQLNGKVSTDKTRKILSPKRKVSR